MNESPPLSTKEGESIFRWIQIPVGILLALFTLLCLFGSVIIVFAPNEELPVLGPVLGVIWIAGCCWVLEKCYRLITGRENKDGLISPRALRAAAWLFLLLPFGGLFTGVFRTHVLIAVIQTVAYVCIFLVLRAWAGSRESHVA